MEGYRLISRLQVEMDRHLTAASHAKLVGAFRGLMGHGPGGTVASFGDITAVSTGIPSSYFNRVFVFERPAPGELNRAVEWMHTQPDPFLLTVVDSALDSTDVLSDGWDLEPAMNPEPGMVLAALDSLPVRSPSVDIRAARDAEEIDEIAELTVQNTDMASDTARQIVPRSMMTDDAFVPMIARVDGRPVGRGLLFLEDDVAGVYNVGVIEAYRRRGIGEAISWEVIRTGRKAGADVSVLQASEMGHPLYERMGFETIVEYHHFRTHRT